MSKNPRLSTHLANRVLFTSIGAALILIVSSVAISTLSFLAIEKEIVEDTIQMVHAALDLHIKSIESTTIDYAHWDDTWDYIASKNPEFVEKNLAAHNLENIGMDFVAIYDGENKLLSLQTLNKNKKVEIEACLSFNPEQESSGLVCKGSAVYLVAIKNIRQSDNSGPTRGSLVFGQALDTELAEKFSQITGSQVSFKMIEERRIQTLERSSPFKRVIGRQILPDLSGNSVAMVELSLDRIIFRRGLRSILGFVLSAIAVFLIAFIGIRLSAARLIIQPIEKLESYLDDQINGTEIFKKELGELSTRKDLVGRTARLIQQAEKEFIKSIEMQNRSREKLEIEIAVRTSEIEKANQALRIYERIIEETSEGVVVTDLDGSVIKVNPAFCSISGYNAEEIVGKNLRMMKSGKHEASFYSELWETLLRKGRWKGEIWDKRKNNSIYPKLLSIDTIRDADGKNEFFVGTSTDISRLKEAEENLNKLAFYDALTGLPNRALFTDRLAQALTHSQRQKERIALLYLDLDHFKDVNDSLGHQAGDELLKEAAERLKAQVRESDTVCRLGGDEFTVVLESVGKSEDAANVAQKIIDVIRAPFMLKGTEVYVGVSVGIALYPYDGLLTEDLIRHADAALYEAKEAGRGQYRFASGKAGKSSKRRIETETLLRRGLDEGRFVVHFQPQVSAGSANLGSSSGITGAEALVRLRDAHGRVVPPDDFIEIAEDTGLIIALGGWVLKKACKEANKWLSMGKEIPVAVNVSQRQFENAIIIGQVEEALLSSGLPPSLLKLEVTESLFMRDTNKAAEIMNEIKNMGLSFAIDDFGTGYSSLRYIDTLPIDSLKIDKSFIQRIESRFDGGEVALAVVALARSFGLISIAEGVETAGQLDALRSRGCDTIQGFYVSKPLAAKAFHKFIHQSPELLAIED
ncbi:hypothetical protein MASR2M78_34910 [Treponema sp.]